MSIATVALSPVYEDHLNLASCLAGQYRFRSNDSILIFLTVGGSVIPLRVKESDSIAYVKSKIQTFKGFFVKKQKLVFDGKELARNNSRVGDYGVADGNILHLVLRLSDIQAITVRTVCGQEFEFHVDRNRNVGYVKEQIAKKGRDFRDLREQELVHDGVELEDKRLINDICKSNDAVIHLLVRKSAKVQAQAVKTDFEVSVVASASNEKGSDAVEKLQERFQAVGLNTVPRSFILEPLIVNPKITPSPVVKQLIGRTFDGMARGHQPIRSSEGSGGAYFMLDSYAQNYVSVFKPTDEEPMAVNNPRGLPLSVDGEGLKKGTRVGEGAFREVAAYILDHPKSGPRSACCDEKGFAGVPPTVMVKCFHTGFNHAEGSEYSSKSIKIGSLQMFRKNSGSCEDFGPRAFPVDAVHRISVLDIRLANADRHAGNILVQKDDMNGQVVLIPIDHGYCFPANLWNVIALIKFEDCTFDWLYWPQAQQPYSAETIAYIHSLDAEKDIELLKFHGWTMSLACARVFRISTMLLKKGAERGLPPCAIGGIMCREALKKESIIEQIVEEAEESVLPGTSEAAFMQSVSVIMDRRLGDLIK